MAEESAGTPTPPWQELKEAYLARLKNPAASSPAELWRLFARDRWFQGQLEARARKALWARVGRLDWLDDVKHEALLILAKKLAKTPDLRVKLEIVDRTFPAWIGAILERACGEAIRQLRRIHRLQLGALDSIADERTENLDERIDLWLALDQQPEPYRTVLLLSAQGRSIQEIADQLKLTYWETYARLHAGLSRLRWRLADYEPEPGPSKTASPTILSFTMTG